MKARIILIIAIFCTFAGKAWGETITKTYLFHGGTGGSQIKFQGYFYEEGKPDTHYICFPSPWTYGEIGNIHASLADGITINISSSNNQIFVQTSSSLAVAGNVTVTVGGGKIHNYYIWHVELYNTANQAVINDSNWDDEDPENTHSFSKTINPGYFYKLVVTYSTDDIYLIDESSTTISGVDNEYLYAGSAITPEPEVECNGRELIRSTHYSCIYNNFDSPGTATLTIEGLSPFHGGVTRDYTIVDPALVPVEWTAGSTVEVTEDYTASSSINVTGTGNVKLVIADGVTLTAQRGITIADDATLTVEGPGSLTVTNDGVVNGENGHAGITGSLIVNGGNTHIRGGRGGSANGMNSTGGQGGAGITGSLTVNGGSIHIQGGDGGFGIVAGMGFNYTNGGDGGDGICNSLVVNGGTVYVSAGFCGVGGKSGHAGVGIGGTVTCTVVGYVIQESADENIWYNLSSGSTSNRRYVRVLESNTISLSAQQANFAGQTYWTTFYHSSNSYNLPSGARAFYMGSDHALYLIGDGSVIPAGCAVVIMAESASLEITYPSKSAPSVTGNILLGTSSAIQAPSGAHVMSQVGETFGFFEYSGEIPAGKAYYVE